MKVSQLIEVKPLSENREFIKTASHYIVQHENHVCSVCGLQVVGHGVESIWLGYTAHDFTPREATPEEVDQAHKLTHEAYRNRSK